MIKDTFKALVVREIQGDFVSNVEKKLFSTLPLGDVLIRVHYSSLNYKDALSATGNKGVTKVYPHTPGIDAVGVVVDSNDVNINAGDQVIVTSYDLGMNTSGGFSEYIRVPSEWVVLLPPGLSMRQAMVYGTAGLTAGMCVSRLREQVTPGDGEILVTGATGGVGSISISILSKLGYAVAALSGKKGAEGYLRSLGANRLIFREEFLNLKTRPLLPPAFAGAVDTVGGVILENVVKSLNPTGVVTCCGNVLSPHLNLTVFPFILRGVSLIGIDSQQCPMPLRKNVWSFLAKEWDVSFQFTEIQEVTLEELPESITRMLDGELKGRLVVKLL